MEHAEQEPAVLCTRAGKVMLLHINSPATRNSIGPAFFEQAGALLDEAFEDPQIGAVVIAGQGGFFSSGGNLQKLAEMGSVDNEQRFARLDAFHDLIRKIRGASVPVITAVEGGAAGAGMSLAFSGHLMVASRQAFFTAAYIKAGLTPDGGLTGLLSQVLPRQLVAYLCLTGERITAQRLYDLGAISQLAEPGQVEAAAVQLASQLAAGPPQATKRILALCGSAGELSIEEQLDREARLMVQSLGGEEAAELIAKIRAGR